MGLAEWADNGLNRRELALIPAARRGQPGSKLGSIMHHELAKRRHLAEFPSGVKNYRDTIPHRGEREQSWARSVEPQGRLAGG